jgi:hypothetical protein
LPSGTFSPFNHSNKSPEAENPQIFQGRKH